jgi:hypothetical protein
MLTIVLVVCGMAGVASSPANANSCHIIALPHGVKLCITDPGSPPHQNPGGGGHTVGWSGCYTVGRVKIPCITEYGVWSAAYQCYMNQLIGVPPSSPLWQGHKRGTLWACTPVHISTPDLPGQTIVWFPPGKSPVLGVPDPGRLARRAVELMELPRSEVHTAPGGSHPAVIGYAVWMWVPGSQWRSESKTVTVGGTSVTATVAPFKVVWQMGTATKVCMGPGRAWVKGMSGAAQTDCQFTYHQTSAGQPHGVFDVRASILFTARWVCRGVCAQRAGTLAPVDGPAGGADLRVQQVQTVVTR